LEENIVLSQIFLPRGGDAIAKMLFVPHEKEVDKLRIYNNPPFLSPHLL
jgi:hypothetical protein